MVVQQPQQQQPQQGMSGAQMVGGIRPPQVAAGNGPQMPTVGGGANITPQQLQSIMQRIKSNTPGEGGGQQHLLQWLKSNPQVMAAIIKQRQAQQSAAASCAQQQQVNGPQQQQQNLMQQQQQGNMVPGSQLQQLMSQQQNQGPQLQHPPNQQPQQNQGPQLQHPPNQVVMGGQAGPHNRVPNVMQNTMQMQQQVAGNMQQQQGPVSI